MNRTDFQQVALERLADAEALLVAGRWSAAYYISGYVVECALKACISKKIKAEEFPPHDAQKLYTHNLSDLLSKAELSVKQMPTAVKVNWAVVASWNEKARYEQGIDETSARNIIEAVRGGLDPRKGGARAVGDVAPTVRTIGVLTIE